MDEGRESVSTRRVLGGNDGALLHGTLKESQVKFVSLIEGAKIVSAVSEPCDYPATLHCAKCGRWFCDAHAEDEEWHPCCRLVMRRRS
jgi:hypothetical protein